LCSPIKGNEPRVHSCRAGVLLGAPVLLVAGWGLLTVDRPYFNKA
jgi:hypothetical protein